MVNLSVFDHLGLLQTKMNFLSQMDKIGFGRGASALGAKKIIFFLNEFEFFTTPIFTYLTSPWNAHFHTSSEALFVSGFVNTFPPRFPFQIGFTVSNIQIQGFNKHWAKRDDLKIQTVEDLCSTVNFGLSRSMILSRITLKFHSRKKGLRILDCG